MAAYGLYTHIASNKMRSMLLLVGLFFLVYVMVFAGALLAEALRHNNRAVDYYLQAAWRDMYAAIPVATIGAVVWIIIAYFFHQRIIDMVTGGRDVTRTEQPRLYNQLENLCISRGIPMPKLKVMDSPALNAFATGLNPKQYAVTVTTGLLNNLDDNEVEAVLGHLAPDVKLTAEGPFQVGGGDARTEVADLCRAATMDLTRKQLTRDRAVWDVRLSEGRGRIEAEIVEGRAQRRGSS